MTKAHDHSKCRNLGQHELHLYADRTNSNQTRIAEMLGLTQQSVSRFMSGIPPTKHKDVKNCERLFGVTPGAFDQPLAPPPEQHGSPALAHAA